MQAKDAPEGWRTLEHPCIELTLRYPDPTPEGRAARIVESETEGGGFRVHLLSEGREVYVEIVHFPPITPEEEHARHREYLEQRFGAGSVSELRDAQIAGGPARVYSFRWPEGERVALLLRISDALYRIIYNSASPLNARVIETLRLRNPPAET